MGKVQSKDSSSLLNLYQLACHVTRLLFPWKQVLASASVLAAILRLLLCIEVSVK
jgi:hypothetical protein